ncbi:MAG TPA: ATP-binding protein [Bryobacteraceae bacterium]|nr:ATP-binding protein [Bryobacteraceae bacterium]
MTQPAGVDYEMRCTFPATFEAAEQFIVEFRRQSQAVLDRESCFAAELLVREALINAVRHGSHNDPRKQVRCCVRLKGGRLLITVKDRGCGFDWRALWSNQAATSDCSGRGIEILRKYASRVRYNDRGNAVAIVKRFSQENHA